MRIDQCHQGDNFCRPGEPVQRNGLGTVNGFGRPQISTVTRLISPELATGQLQCARLMASPGGLGRLETSRTAGPSGLNLLPPPSIWPHLRRATPATWHSGFTFRGSSLTTGSRAAVGRLVSGRTALTRNGSPAPDDDSGAPWSCTHSLQQQAGPGSGSARERRSVLARSSASAGASAGGQASWPSGGGAGWESSDASENGAGPRGTATAARGADNGGDGAATAVVTPGSARDLLRSTLNAIDVLQSPFKANDMYDQDKGQDDAVHIEHGLASASASVGRAVYEVHTMVCCVGRQAKVAASDAMMLALLQRCALHCS